MTVLIFDDVKSAGSGIVDGVAYHVVNPFTLEDAPLLDLPNTQIEGLGGHIFQQAGHNYLLYQDGDDYHLFDIERQTDQRVLIWLTADSAESMDKSIAFNGDGEIVIFIRRQYGFDVSDALSIDSLLASTSYQETMRMIRLPEVILPAFSSWQVSTSAIVVSRQVPGLAFSWLDYSVGTMQQYCSTPFGFRRISPDGRFAAFSLQELPNPQPIPKMVVILNLETGLMSQIDDYEFVGWATVGE